MMCRECWDPTDGDELCWYHQLSPEQKAHVDYARRMALLLGIATIIEGAVIAKMVS